MDTQHRETARLEIESEEAWADLREFVSEHPGVAFRVFRPEEVERAFTDDVPLLPDGY